MKFIEAVIQLRPRSLWRVLAHPDLPIRAAMKWYYSIGRQVWPYEIRNFLFRDRRRKDGLTLAEFWRAPGDMDLRIPCSVPSQNEQCVAGIPGDYLSKSLYGVGCPTTCILTGFSFEADSPLGDAVTVTAKMFRSPTGTQGVPLTATLPSNDSRSPEVLNTTR